MQNLDAKKRRVLIVDDNQNIHDDYRKILDWKSSSRHDHAALASFFDGPTEESSEPVDPFEIQIDSALQGQQGLEMVKQAITEDYPYSLAFVDIRMPPGWDGLKTVGELWKVDPDLQVVICSAYSDNRFEDIHEKFGRSDSLLILKKPFDAIEVYQIAVALTEKWILSRKARLKQVDLEKLVLERTLELERASMQDPLTKIANRTKFNSMLEDALKRNHRHQTMTGLLLLDVDYFKEINDAHGHPVGDELLIQIAERLESVIRDTDTVARLGGDEFAIIQPEANHPSEVRVVLERILEAVSQPFDLEDKHVNCKFSIGIAISPTDGSQAEELMKRADVALYRSKESGRARASFYEPEMDEESIKTRIVVADLASAVGNSELQLFYQPIYQCKGLRLITQEALLRWNHPERGLLAPDAFLSAAEESGRIREIGEWVLREATATAAKWPIQTRVAVNLSPVQFHPKFDIFDTIMSSLSASGLDPRRLEIEITENVLLRDFELATRAIDRLRECGVHIVLDDFGVGHSSLNYLKTFAFDKIKLDRSFVWSADSCDKSRAILNSVASLGRELGIGSTAEGIETESHLDRVVKAGFTEVQGYLFSKPVPTPNLGEATVFPSVTFPGLDSSTNETV